MEKVIVWFMSIIVVIMGIKVWSLHMDMQVLKEQMKMQSESNKSTAEMVETFMDTHK